jgi:hypothetical protein
VQDAAPTSSMQQQKTPPSQPARAPGRPQPQPARNIFIAPAVCVRTPRTWGGPLTLTPRIGGELRAAQCKRSQDVPLSRVTARLGKGPLCSAKEQDNRALPSHQYMPLRTNTDPARHRKIQADEAKNKHTRLLYYSHAATLILDGSTGVLHGEEKEKPECSITFKLRSRMRMSLSRGTCCKNMPNNPDTRIAMRTTTRLIILIKPVPCCACYAAMRCLHAVCSGIILYGHSAREPPITES